MPTIRPLPATGDGDGEGQLKPITVKGKRQPTAPAPPRTAPTQPSAPQQPSPKAQPAPPVQPQMREHRQSAPAPRPVQGRTILTGMKGGPSLRGSKPAEAPAHASAASATAQRTNPYDEASVRRLWDAFIMEHPTEVILVNTMRASRPVLSDAAFHKWTVTVENAAQKAKIEEHMPALLKALRDGTSNDLITLAVTINAGASGAHTWNERQVLEKMLEKNPAMEQFIKDFKLNLG